MYGVNDSDIQHLLLSKLVLTLETAMKIVLGMESAAQNAITLQGGGEASAASSGEVFKFTRTKPGSSSSSSKQQIPWCARCGKPGHHTSKCRFKDAKSHHCDEVGHTCIKSACLALKSVQTKL